MSRLSTFELRRDGSRIVLPSTHDPESYVQTSTWGGYTDDPLDQFTARVLRERGPGPVSVGVELVPRPDNEYSDHAVSVVLPDVRGRTLDERHLAFLPESYLYRVGRSLIPDLHAALTRAHGRASIICTGVVLDVGELVLDLPPGHVLGPDIVTYLKELDPRYTPSIRPGWDKRPGWYVPRDDHRHTTVEAETEWSLRCISTFQEPHTPPGELKISTVLTGRGEPRHLLLQDAVTGRLVGAVALGFLFLDDERDRDAVLPLLRDAGVPVAQPRDASGIELGQWPANTVPNIWTYWFTEKLDLRQRDPKYPNGQGWLARFNPTSRVLWVEDSRLVAPARLYAARVGLDVARVGLPARPWGLEDEVPYTELKDVTLDRDRHDLGLDVTLLEDARDLVPPELFLPREVGWTTEPDAPPLPETPEFFVLHERYVRSRGLFGSHELTGTTVGCRLCGRPAAEFRAAVVTVAVGYCHRCLSAAASGLVKERKRATKAVRLLAELEFDGAPMLEEQLNTLHVNPDQPVEPAVVDTMLLLRFAVARGHFPWTLLLEETGLVKDGLRRSRGTLIRARDGHLCHSMREKAVCDFLHQHRIAHDREPLYPKDTELNANGRRRADWRLSDGTLVELWGLPDDPVYAAKMVMKRTLALRHDLRLVEITDAELPFLPRVFADWMPADGLGSEVTSWSWSPAMPHQDAVPKAKLASNGGTRGRNDFNTAVRLERLARAEEAVRLQRAGLSRAQVGIRLGVSKELVKELLRDGKFYADPASDPLRTELAREAARARAEGLTRAQFQEAQGLTAPKAQEAWRDADVLHGQEPSEAAAGAAFEGACD